MSSEKASFDDIEIVAYSEKSFVIRGETRQYRESMRTLGGKWNSSLTDKDTGEKFGGWIFPSSKLAQVKQWKQSGEHLKFTASASTSAGATSSAGVQDICKTYYTWKEEDTEDNLSSNESVGQRLTYIENRLSQIESVLNQLLRNTTIGLSRIESVLNKIPINTTIDPSSPYSTSPPSRGTTISIKAKAPKSSKSCNESSASSSSKPAIVIADDSCGEEEEEEIQKPHRRLL